MAYLHTNSCECVKSELDLFTIPPTQTSIEKGQWIHFKPISVLNDDAPLEFVISGLTDEYIDLSHTLLYLRLRLLKEDNTKFTDVENIAPVNNTLHSVFSQVDTYLNQKLISPPNNTYGYRSYIETLLSYGPNAKNSHLTAGMWYMDTPHQVNSKDIDNKGYQTRKKLTLNSREIDLIGKIHGDLFNQEKFLLGGVELRLRFVRARNSFCLLSAGDLKGKIEILEATLLVRRAKISPTVLLAHNKALERATAKYPITRVDVKVLTIPAGLQSKSLDNIYIGQLPKRCVIGFVSNKSFNGSYDTNPFDFKHYSINYLSLYIDGDQIPSKPLQPDFENNMFIRSYQSLFSGTGIHFSNEGNAISREDYKGGYFLTAFDLTPDMSAGSTHHWNLIRNGTLRIEVSFVEALPETVNLILYTEFDNIIEIDKNRNVIVDYSS